MSDKSKIEWTDATWNPIRGCSVVSEGCRNCYAMQVAARFSGEGQAYEGLAYRNESGAHWTGEVRLIREHLGGTAIHPLRWTRPRRIFVNSMSDLFHEGVPDEYVARVAAIMEQADWHTYQVLTKRAARMRSLLSTSLRRIAAAPHVWWGVSVEDRKHGLPRVKELRASPARVRFLSIEPLLEDLGALDLEGVLWVIVGGESGRGARVMRPDWVRRIRRQTRRAGVAFFFKQWGGVQKKRAGRLLDGRTWDEMPSLAEATPRDQPVA